MSESRLKLIKAVLLLLALNVFSTLGLMAIEGLSVFDALWLTVISISTTGYGDVVPHTVRGKAFLMLILITGLVVVAYSLGTIINILVEGQLLNLKGNGKMIKAIDNMSNHVIVCGAGRVGGNVAAILHAEHTPYVLIDTNEELIGQLRQNGHLALHGDATKDELLHQAGIARAKGIICALANDAYNVFVVLTARALNPGLHIVSRAVQPESVAKLRHAGADKIISPDQIGGHRMAMAMLKPTAIELMDTMFAPHNLEIMLEEMKIAETSAMANRPVQEFFGKGICDAMLVAITRESGAKMNPCGDEIMQPGDVLVLIGSRHDLQKMEAAGLG